MRTMKALFQKEAWVKRVLGFAVSVLIFSVSGFISQAAEGKVIADTARIRAEANADSEVVGSTAKGKTVDIVGAVKDSAGNVWYKVPNGNNTYGYIRSDLIETSDEIKITETASAGTESTSKPADTVPTAIEEQQASISVKSANIRSGASKQHDSVSTLPQGTAITLIGEANDSAGNKWYQITCSYNGKTVQGYVRSDLITIGAAASTENNEANGDANTDSSAEGENQEGQEGENPEGSENTEGTEGEQQQPPVEEHSDYEIVYNDETYWLYDNTNNTMMSVVKLLEVVNQANESNDALQSQIKTEKIIIIVLAVIIALLVIGVTILLFKLRDAYYYEEDYEEEIEEEPVVPKKKKRRTEEAEEDFSEEPVPAKKKKVREAEPDVTERPVRKRTSAEGAEGSRPVRQKTMQDAEIQAAERKQTTKKPVQRKAQNFLVDDDEFEFEFLNMDDKDL